MSSSNPKDLSRRERQIMDILHRLGRASPTQVRAALPDPPSYTAVNTLLRILGERGHISRVQESLHFVYFPTQPRQSAARSAARQLVDTFFGGRVERAVTTMLSEAEADLTEAEIAHLTAAIERFKHKQSGEDGQKDDQDEGKAL